MHALQPNPSGFDPPAWEASPRPGASGLDAALRRALSEGELRFDFQPLVAVASGATTGFEALLRWRRPGMRDLAAGSFIADAEGMPGFDDIGVWALIEAARAAAPWPSRLRVAVNLSAAQLRSTKVIDCVGRLVDQGRIDPRRVAGDREVGAATLECGQERTEITAAEIDDDQRCRARVYASMPFVDGTSPPPTTLACANERANALKAASHK